MVCLGKNPVYIDATGVVGDKSLIFKRSKAGFNSEFLLLLDPFFCVCSKSSFAYVSKNVLECFVT